MKNDLKSRTPKRLTKKFFDKAWNEAVKHDKEAKKIMFKTRPQRKYPWKKCKNMFVPEGFNGLSSSLRYDEDAYEESALERNEKRKYKRDIIIIALVISAFWVAVILCIIGG